MRTRIFSTRIALFVTLFGLAAGCQQEPAALTPVTGRVSYRGTPVHGGIIVFTPDASKGESGPIAHSKIQEDGLYTLITGEAPGARPGWYRVTVSSPGPAGSQPGHANILAEATIPDDYRHPEKSKINCKVNVDQPNSFDFDLK